MRPVIPSMTIRIPDELQWLSWLAGSEWPESDETKLFELAANWRQAAEELLRALPDLRHGTDATLTAYSGEGSAAMRAEFAQLFSGDNSIEALARGLAGLGEFAESTASQVEYAKLQVVSTLAILALQIAWALTVLWGAWAVPAMEVATQSAIKQIVAALLDKIAALGQLFGRMSYIGKIAFTAGLETVIGVAQEVGIQGAQISSGHRKSWDGLQIAVAGASSATGAVAGFATSHAIVTKFVKAPPATFWGAAGLALATGIPGGVAGAGAGWLTSGVLTGQFEWDWRMLVGALGGSVVGGASGMSDHILEARTSKPNLVAPGLTAPPPQTTSTDLSVTPSNAETRSAPPGSETSHGTGDAETPVRLGSEAGAGRSDGSAARPGATAAGNGVPAEIRQPSSTGTVPAVTGTATSASVANLVAGSEISATSGASRGETPPTVSPGEVSRTGIVEPVSLSSAAPHPAARATIEGPGLPTATGKPTTVGTSTNPSGTTTPAAPTTHRTATPTTAPDSATGPAAPTFGATASGNTTTVGATNPITNGTATNPTAAPASTTDHRQPGLGDSSGREPSTVRQPLPDEAARARTPSGTRPPGPIERPSGAAVPNERTTRTAPTHRSMANLPAAGDGTASRPANFGRIVAAPAPAHHHPDTSSTDHSDGSATTTRHTTTEPIADSATAHPVSDHDTEVSADEPAHLPAAAAATGLEPDQVSATEQLRYARPVHGAAAPNGHVWQAVPDLFDLLQNIAAPGMTATDPDYHRGVRGLRTIVANQLDIDRRTALPQLDQQPTGPRRARQQMFWTEIEHLAAQIRPESGPLPSGVDREVHAHLLDAAGRATGNRFDLHNPGEAVRQIGFAGPAVPDAVFVLADGTLHRALPWDEVPALSTDARSALSADIATVEVAAAMPPIPLSAPDNRLVVVDRAGQAHVLARDVPYRIAVEGDALVLPPDGTIRLPISIMPDDVRFESTGGNLTLTWEGAGTGIRYVDSSDTAHDISGGATLLARPADGGGWHIKETAAAEDTWQWVGNFAEVMGAPHIADRSDVPLFGAHGPRPEDVTQGRLGDCYILSLLEGMATHRPADLLDMFREYEDGTVGVRFIVDGAPTWVRVDKRIYVHDDGTGYFARHDPGGPHRPAEPIWAVLAEKAFATQFGAGQGYHAIDNGGKVAQAAVQLGTDYRRLDGAREQDPEEDGYFLHPMAFTDEALHQLLGIDREFARLVADPAVWNEHIARTNEATVALTVRYPDDPAAVHDAEDEFVLQDSRAIIEGLATEPRWDRDKAVLIDFLQAMYGGPNTDRTGIGYLKLLGAIANTIDTALSSGTLVNLTTREFAAGAPTVAGLTGTHTYSVVGVERDEHGAPARIVLNNPWNELPIDPTTGAIIEPAEGIEYRTHGPANLGELRRSRGIIAVDLIHLPKFVHLTTSDFDGVNQHRPGALIREDLRNTAHTPDIAAHLTHPALVGGRGTARAQVTEQHPIHLDGQRRQIGGRTEFAERLVTGPSLVTRTEDSGDATSANTGPAPEPHATPAPPQAPPPQLNLVSLIGVMQAPHGRVWERITDLVDFLYRSEYMAATGDAGARIRNVRTLRDHLEVALRNDPAAPQLMNQLNSRIRPFGGRYADRLVEIAADATLNAFHVYRSDGRYQLYGSPEDSAAGQVLLEADGQFYWSVPEHQLAAPPITSAPALAHTPGVTLELHQDGLVLVGSRGEWVQLPRDQGLEVVRTTENGDLEVRTIYQNVLLSRNILHDSVRVQGNRLSWNGSQGGLRYLADNGVVVHLANGADIVARAVGDTANGDTRIWIKSPSVGEDGWTLTNHMGLVPHLPRLADRTDAPLFAPQPPGGRDTGPSPDDVQQGLTGDCYVMALLKELGNRPALLHSMIHEYRDGTVAVRFLVGGRPEWVRVTKEIYVHPATGHGYFAAHAPRELSDPASEAGYRSALWPALVEKAYAVRFGDGNGYHGIGLGGAAADAANHLGLGSFAPGTEIVIPKTAVNLSLFLHPMYFSTDALARNLRLPIEFLTQVFGDQQRWNQHAQALIAETGRLANLYPDDTQAADRHYFDFARREFHTVVESLAPDSWENEKKSLTVYMDAAFGPEVRDRSLHEYRGIARAMADEIQAALDRGATVTLDTYTFGGHTAEREAVPGLLGNHVYLLLGIELDEKNRPARFVLEDPNSRPRKLAGTQQPAAGIEFRTYGPRNENELRRAAGVIAVDIAHLPKFEITVTDNTLLTGPYGNRRIPDSISDTASTISADEPDAVAGARDEPHGADDLRTAAEVEGLLGSIRDNLPGPVWESVHRYTGDRVLNEVLRSSSSLAEIERDALLAARLTQLNDMAAVADSATLARLRERHDLGSLDTELHDPRQPDDSLDDTLDTIYDNADRVSRLRAQFDDPTADFVPQAERMVQLLDIATDQPLTGIRHLVRGLDDMEFMLAADGERLGLRDLAELLGTVQTDPGYLSTSVGTEPIRGGGESYSVRLDLHLPPDARGLWIGPAGRHPAEHEVLLGRGTRYRITDVHEINGDTDGIVVITAEVLPRYLLSEQELRQAIHRPDGEQLLASWAADFEISMLARAANGGRRAQHLPDFVGVLRHPEIHTAVTARGARTGNSEAVGVLREIDEAAYYFELIRDHYGVPAGYTLPIDPADLRKQVADTMAAYQAERTPAVSDSAPPATEWRSMPADGDCFIHALRAITGNESSIAEIRARLVTEIRADYAEYLAEFGTARLTAHAADLGPDAGQEQWNAFEEMQIREFEQQLTDLSRPGAWNLELADLLPRAAARAFGIGLQVHTPGGVVTDPFGPADADRIFHVLVANNHYYLAVQHDVPATTARPRPDAGTAEPEPADAAPRPVDIDRSADDQQGAEPPGAATIPPDRTDAADIAPESRTLPAEHPQTTPPGQNPTESEAAPRAITSLDRPLAGTDTTPHPIAPPVLPAEHPQSSAPPDRQSTETATVPSYLAHSATQPEDGLMAEIDGVRAPDGLAWELLPRDGEDFFDAVLPLLGTEFDDTVELVRQIEQTIDEDSDRYRALFSTNALDAELFSEYQLRAGVQRLTGLDLHHPHHDLTGWAQSFHERRDEAFDDLCNDLRNADLDKVTIGDVLPRAIADTTGLRFEVHYRGGSHQFGPGDSPHIVLLAVGADYHFAVPRTEASAVTEPVQSGITAVAGHLRDAAEAERYLGSVLDTLPMEQYLAVARYTTAPSLRAYLGEPERLAALAQKFHHANRLTALNQGMPPVDRAELTALLDRRDLTPDDRIIIESLRPDQLAALREQAETFRALITDLDFRGLPEPRTAAAPALSTPNGRQLADYGAHLAVELRQVFVQHLDRAVAQPLPASVSVVHHARDIRHLLHRLPDHTRQGLEPERLRDEQRPAELAAELERALEGLVISQRDYLTAIFDTSSATTGTAANHSAPVRLELTVPAGAHGLWVGKRGVQSSAGELILPRQTEMRVRGVIGATDDAGRAVLTIRAEVVSPRTTNAGIEPVPQQFSHPPTDHSATMAPDAADLHPRELPARDGVDGVPAPHNGVWQALPDDGLFHGIARTLDPSAGASPERAAELRARVVQAIAADPRRYLRMHTDRLLLELLRADVLGQPNEAALAVLRPDQDFDSEFERTFRLMRGDRFLALVDQLASGGEYSRDHGYFVHRATAAALGIRLEVHNPRGTVQYFGAAGGPTVIVLHTVENRYHLALPRTSIPTLYPPDPVRFDQLAAIRFQLGDLRMIGRAREQGWDTPLPEQYELRTLATDFQYASRVRELNHQVVPTTRRELVRLRDRPGLDEQHRILLDNAIAAHNGQLAWTGILDNARRFQDIYAQLDVLNTGGRDRTWPTPPDHVAPGDRAEYWYTVLLESYFAFRVLFGPPPMALPRIAVPQQVPDPERDIPAHRPPTPSAPEPPAKKPRT